ncbi:MAG: serine hydrolase domain-containing protein [Clostridiales bacterium]
MKFKNSILKIIIGSMFSAILLIVAYIVPWFNWLVFFAFVPFLITIRNSKRLKIYLSSTILTFVYICFVVTLIGSWKHFNLIYLLIVILISIFISEIQILSRKATSYKWIAQPVLWILTILICKILFNQILKFNNIYYYVSMFESLINYSKINFTSHSIYKIIAGTNLVYVLYFIVLIINTGLSEIYNRYKDFKKSIRFYVIALALALFIGLYGGPIKDLHISTPKEHNMNENILLKMSNLIPDKYPHVLSIVVARNDNIVFEKYYNGTTKHTLNALCSITKNFSNALVGTAIQNGYIKDVEQKALDFFPEYQPYVTNPKVKNISIKNLLTMRAGFTFNKISGNDSDIYSSNDWIKYMFSQSFITAPGESYSYLCNNTPVHILSGLVNKKSGMKHSQYPDKYIFSKLGIYKYFWFEDPQGNKHGMGGLYLRTQDMVKFGCLYLNDGIWKNERILPKGWVKKSTMNYTDNINSHGESFGYLFRTSVEANHKTYIAAGYGGQYIFIVPDLKLVVAINSKIDAHRESHRSILEEYIIPSIK